MAVARVRTTGRPVAVSCGAGQGDLEHPDMRVHRPGGPHRELFHGARRRPLVELRLSHTPPDASVAARDDPAGDLDLLVQVIARTDPVVAISNPQRGSLDQEDR